MIVSRSVIIFVVVVALLSLSGATRAPCHGERKSERESASVEDTHISKGRAKSSIERGRAKKETEEEMGTKIRITTAKVDDRRSERGRCKARKRDLLSRCCTTRRQPEGRRRYFASCLSRRETSDDTRTHMRGGKEAGVDRKGGYLRPSRRARMARMTKGADLPMNS